MALSHGQDDMDPSAEKALDAAFWGTSQGERSAGRGHRPPLLLVEALWQRAEARPGDQRNPRLGTVAGLGAGCNLNWSWA